MRHARAIAFLLVVFACALSVAAEPPAAPVVLPAQFSGWQVKDTVTKSKDPAVADPVNAPILQEYGFDRFEKATYTRDDGRTLAVKAAVFADASGAYGAFTYYKTPVMLNEKIGGQGSSLNNRVLFYQGNVLVDAVFDRLNAMSAADLRELANMLPAAAGNAGNLPSLPTYLPREKYQKNTAKYVMGPTTLERLGSPLPSSAVDFKLGAEVVLAKYEADGGEATLMLISYPTPQIAAEKLKQLEVARQASPEGGTPTAQTAQWFPKRTGPIVAVASGALSAREAKVLLGLINYEADVTWNENTYFTKKDNVANFLFNAILLCGIVVGLALVAGVAFGGIRILIKRAFPNRVFDRPEDMEIISLHLDENLEGASRRR